MTTVKDVQRAQVLIERCMLTYMPFEEVQTKLHHESDVEPALTQVVWRKLQVAPLSTSGSSPWLCLPILGPTDRQTDRETRSLSRGRPYRSSDELTHKHLPLNADRTRT